MWLIIQKIIYFHLSWKLFRNNLTVKVIFFLIPTILSVNSYAIDYVYRVDGRPPEEIFKEGFFPWGNNTSLSQHVNGTSCGRNGTSAYVATTSNRDQAMRIAATLFSAQRIRGENRPPLYLYTIRADRNIYSVRTSARHLISLGDSSFTERTNHSIDIQQEYVAIVPPGSAQGTPAIRPQQIMSADRLTYNEDNFRAESITPSIRNEIYLNSRAHANEGIIPNLHLESNINRPVYAIITGTLACYAVVTSCISGRNKRDGKNLCVDSYSFDLLSTTNNILMGFIE
ncbi:Pertussis toxin subunit 1 precursor [Photorhabdus australis subsp. thailandensis]|uniref:Pertussis toxin subunit 1 n=1 Tax=Photorhabdus australis subsp. thailandensis TaxID=2805096 RepID=A0A1C0U287_9GAMM|nr:enterotoxin A family protein [Photorhabdus australis]OCQ52013.1 Pertussis toxin subunit 1 precursor [Photorhabdus australis subsp. thailandensis]